MSKIVYPSRNATKSSGCSTKIQKLIKLSLYRLCCKNLFVLLKVDELGGCHVKLLRDFLVWCNFTLLWSSIINSLQKIHLNLLWDFKFVQRKRMWKINLFSSLNSSQREITEKLKSGLVQIPIVGSRNFLLHFLANFMVLTTL